MASAVDSRLAYARLSAVATASRLPTANRGSNNSYTTSWDTTPRDDTRTIFDARNVETHVSEQSHRPEADLLAFNRKSAKAYFPPN